jgi:hypothetical protein
VRLEFGYRTLNFFVNERIDADKIMVAAKLNFFLPVVGFLLAYGVLTNVLIPRLGIGGVERILNLGNHIQCSNESNESIVVLGNSIVREGFDAHIFNSKLEDLKAENFAIGGCTFVEQQMIVERLLESTSYQKTAFVLPFGPTSLSDTDSQLPLDKAYAYAY